MTLSISKLTNALDHAVDWFIPASIVADKDLRKQARLFLISHLLGPFIGNTVPLALYLFDPQPSWDIAVLSASITGFWIFPLVLRAIGHYHTLALLSIQNLMFCILWSCYFYGGVTSPTLPWVLTIPLLAFFYIDDSVKLRYAVLLMFALNSIGFGLISYYLPAPEHGIPQAAMQGLGIVSTMAAAAYVAMMAVYYARALASQAELEAVVRHQRTTAQHLRIATLEAERASKAKAEFLAKMSHELRTPLNAVIGYSQMLLEEAEETGDFEDVPDIERIHAAGVHLLRLVNSVLDLSKIEAGHMELFVETFSLRSVVDAVIEDVRPHAEQNGNRLSVSFDPSIPTIRGDQMKTQAVIGNVVRNASKYTHGGTVELVCSPSTLPTGAAVRIEVRDTGIGIDGKDLPHIFERFTVVDDETSSKYGGTGIGLALTRELCRMMGGSIQVASTLGKGSTFTIMLPLEIAAEKNGAADAASGETERLTETGRPNDIIETRLKVA
ncbi:sensor histidine kinase [Gellertiella hungarica]|uniref:histidine kinase n=1 Tax=Gellertiella hungarica TaxID=1572859 RepID=A0A7W6NM60_9HYPH|nr:HAMP domain-containing sensor histidine kinase [Gellertiella hungarica]MBB4066145.1 signal transduction histidine kinase [Gellertiella hungarica]